MRKEKQIKLLDTLKLAFNGKNEMLLQRSVVEDYIRMATKVLSSPSIRDWLNWLKMAQVASTADGINYIVKKQAIQEQLNQLRNQGEGQ